MAFQPQDKLDAVLHDELRKLPEFSAPAAFAPRVLAVIRARAALPWWRRSWWEWPLAARSGFVGVVTVAIALGVVFGLPLVSDLGASAVGLFASRWAVSALELVKSLEPLVSASGSLWRAAQPAVISLLAVCGLLYLSCVGLGTMFLRVAVRRI